MEFKKLPGFDGVVQVVNSTGRPLVTDAQSALDLIATARYTCGDVKLVIVKEDIAEPFFDLKTCIAGEVLQKFVNYQMAMAIVGDFSGYTSKSLQDFIRESNRGSAVFFVPDTEAAAQKLTAV